MRDLPDGPPIQVEPVYLPPFEDYEGDPIARRVKPRTRWDWRDGVKHLGVQMPQTLHRDLKTQCFLQGRTMGAVVRELIEGYIKSCEEEDDGTRD